MSGSPSEIALRLPRSAYLVVFFLLLGVIPLTFADTGTASLKNGSGYGSTGVALGWRLVFLLIPVAAAFFVARTATFVGPDGIRIRALLGSRAYRWDEIRGLSVIERAIYAVVPGGSVRLPCARIAHLHDISQASGGRLPEVERHVPKSAPMRRRRR